MDARAERREDYGSPHHLPTQPCMRAITGRVRVYSVCFFIESPEAVSVSEWVRACGIAPLLKSTSAPKSWISVSGTAKSFRPEISF